MPPLVVIRSSCKHVEYQENRSAWRRVPCSRRSRTSDDHGDSGDDHSDSDGDDWAARDDPDEDDALLRRVEAQERSWRVARGGSALEASKVYGFSCELRDVSGMHAFRCADCGNVVADRDDIVSKSFFGRTGKAFLMNNMYNIRAGPSRNRYLMTGMHTIADVVCNQCDFVLGWKYVKAMESSQKYKEGKFIMENAVVQDDAEEQTWDRL